MVSTSVVTAALKEWAVAVDALAQAETIVLLRKGGIREQAFAVTQSRFWLYPTYEHQKPALLKPEFASRAMLMTHPEPEAIKISAWAEVTHSFQISEPAAIGALLLFHIWTAEFVSERLKWKPRLPLAVLLLRTYCLVQPQLIPYRSEYGGCRSWVTLEIPPDMAAAIPVLSEADYLQQVQTVTGLIERLDQHPSHSP
jgi:hypothetical protein